MEKSIVVLAEHFEGEVRPVTYELLSGAAEIAAVQPAPIHVVVLGGGEVEGLARRIAGQTGAHVIAVMNPDLLRYNGELYKALLGNLLPELDPSYVLAPHTTRGMDFMPGLALRLGGGSLSAVVGMGLQEGGGIYFVRPLYNGKIQAKVCPTTDLVFLTIQPGAFQPRTSENTGEGSVDLRQRNLNPERVRAYGGRRPQSKGFPLAEAEVIVAAGRGIGKKENLALVTRLASLFPRSAVGGSRPVCDSGWLDYSRQVGLTGSVVTPKLYIACGISGAAQHLAGMRGASYVVAINKDPEAEMCRMSDLCIVEDLTTFIPTLLKVKEEEGSG
jgi:electron transfer flavoprotein alpha subunit